MAREGQGYPCYQRDMMMMMMMMMILNCYEKSFDFSFKVSPNCPGVQDVQVIN